MLGVDHDQIILLYTPFPTMPILGTNCCCNVILFYVGNNRCCIVFYQYHCLYNAQIGTGQTNSNSISRPIINGSLPNVQQLLTL